MKMILKAGIAAAALFIATPASAALVEVGPGCDVTTPSPDAVDCAGAYAGNLNSGARIDDLNAAIDVLMGFDHPDFVWADLDPLKITISSSSSIVDLGAEYIGMFILSAHFGDAGSGLGDHTILYLFNFEVGTQFVDLGQSGLSQVVPVGAPIPEPATWAMMLLGFGAMGVMIRRTRRRREQLPQLA